MGATNDPDLVGNGRFGENRAKTYDQENALVPAQKTHSRPSPPIGPCLPRRLRTAFSQNQIPLWNIPVNRQTPCPGCGR